MAELENIRRSILRVSTRAFRPGSSHIFIDIEATNGLGWRIHYNVSRRKFERFYWSSGLLIEEEDLMDLLISALPPPIVSQCLAVSLRFAT